MKRLAVTLLGLLFLAIAAILIWTYVNDHSPESPGNSTDVAINIALEDAKRSEALQQTQYRFTASTRPIDASSGKGFINYPGDLVGVYIQATPPMGPPPLVNYDYIVDTNRSRIVDRASWLDMTPGDDVTIPPGSAWYHRVISTMTGFSGIDPSPRTYMKSSNTPADADVSQFLISEEGLYRLMNLSRSTPLRDIDVPQEVTVYNQSETRGPSWNATITWPMVEAKNMPGVVASSSPTYRAEGNYYIIVINREANREISLSQWAFTGSLW